MGGPGFAKLGNQLIKHYNNLITSKNKQKHFAGKSINGKSPMSFGQANQQVKNQIKQDKKRLQQQFYYKIISLVIGILIFASILFGLILWI